MFLIQMIDSPVNYKLGYSFRCETKSAYLSFCTFTQLKSLLNRNTHLITHVSLSLKQGR